MALAAWSRESGGKLKFVPAAQEANALVRVRWISAADGLYGETQRTTVNGKPGAIVNVSPSVAGLGEPVATMASKDRLLRDTIVYLTCVHETGHALGLQHTRNFEDIMYAFGYGGDIVEYFSRYRRNIKSRADIARFSGLSTGDIRFSNPCTKRPSAVLVLLLGFRSQKKTDQRPDRGAAQYRKCECGGNNGQRCRWDSIASSVTVKSQSWAIRIATTNAMTICSTTCMR